MIDLLQMWALVEALGLVCLPLTITVCHNLPDRGWAFSKALGLALLAFCVWLPLMYGHSLPFSQLFIAVIALLILICNLLGLRRTYQTIVKVVRSHAVYILACELVFLVMVFQLGWLRTFNPNIQSYEMFMDEGFIAAIMRSPHLPPPDMWLAGYSINYYYYTHFTVAMLAKLLGQSPSIAFNTGISMYFGLTAVNLFGVSSNIVAWARRFHAQKKIEPTMLAEQVDQVHAEYSHSHSGPDQPITLAEQVDQVYSPLVGSIPYGILTMVIGLILGNLAATQQWWQKHGEIEAGLFNWFAPSRVIDNTINEFPAFSFLLSCFHAHVLTLAFTILAVGLAFNLLLEPQGVGLSVFGHGWRFPFTLGMTALVLGGLLTMNSWDFPTYMALTLACISIQHWLAYQKQFQLALLSNICLASLPLVSLAFFLFIPFYFNFTSPSQGFRVVAPQDRSPLGEEFLIYGLFLFIFISLLIKSTWKRPLFVQKRSSISAEIILLVIFATLVPVDIAIILLIQNSITLVVMGTIAIIAAVLLFYHIEDRSHAFILLLGGFAFALVAGCEVFFLKDILADQYPRANTVFKFYFQAWALLSIASGAGLFFLLERFWSLKALSPKLRWLEGTGKAVWAIVLLAFFLASTIYPIYAPPARLLQINPQTGKVALISSNSLDGLNYLKYCRPPQLHCKIDITGDYDAIRWLNTHVQGIHVIVEAIGDDSSPSGRISVFTGLATLMGEKLHEYQWRANWIKNAGNQADFRQRFTDVSTIYSSADPHQVLAMMARYHAQYLYVGAMERLAYHKSNLQRFALFMNIAYHAEGVTIYTPHTY